MKVWQSVIMALQQFKAIWSVFALQLRRLSSYNRFCERFVEREMKDKGVKNDNGKHARGSKRVK